MVRNPILAIVSIFVAAGVLTVAAGITYSLIQTTGTYETGLCKSPSGEVRQIDTEASFARDFDVTWSQLGPSLQITLTESEITSRARELLDDHLPVDEITICFHDGYAEAFAHSELPVLGRIPLLGGLFDASVRLRGSVDFDGPYARLTISEFDIDDIPGFIGDRLRDEIERETNVTLATLPLKFDYQVTFEEGRVIVSVTP
ncbi:MAG: hypothetical protein IIA90_00015 [Chloroflexi bacterium]|nr:hypothetical protein [Chloroflexota bacterium]